MREIVSTDCVEPNQRLAFWTDLVCNTYVQLDCDAASGSSMIEGNIGADQLATLQLSRVTATPQIVRRCLATLHFMTARVLMSCILSDHSSNMFCGCRGQACEPRFAIPNH
jgi:hypothetical protein